MSGEFEEFKTEILEMLDHAEEALLQFEGLPDGQSSKSLYDEVFRAYHNIKGAAGMMDWAELQHHVHHLENVLMLSKDTSSIPKNLIGWFLKGHDATRAILSGQPYEFDYNVGSTSTATPEELVEELLEEKPIASDLKEVTPTTNGNKMTPPEDFYAEVNEGLDRISLALIKMESNSGDKVILDSLYRDIHSLKGAVQLFGLEEASGLAHAMENSLEKIRGLEKFEMDKSHVSTLLLCVDLMNLCVKDSSNQELGKEVQFMAKLLIPFAETKVQELEVKSVAVAPEVQEKNTPVPQGGESSEKADTSIRVQVSLLDRLMTLMGEMVLVRNQVLQYSSDSDDLDFINLSKKLDVVTSELQEETMKTRMQPIGNILTKFQRVVRDLSGSLNKKINLVLIGVETELDKTLIEAIKDPLTHIVRNSCDHGIESPEERVLADKSGMGTIEIKAYHEGGQVVVDITDDGKGLKREKILDKAIEKGIVTPEKSKLMSDREVNALIFAPGFSTAEKVTNVSGRGVGMDVVRSNVEKIGGHVDISSTEGKGTKITIKIPLTLAIVPAMIVRVEDERFAIPQMKLVELVRVERKAIESLQGQEIYRLRGNLLPLLDLCSILERPRSDKEQETINIAVLNSDAHQFGLIVDEILDTADIVVKPLARFLKPVSIYSGATVLGDGSVAFILDVLGISQKFLSSSSVSSENNRNDMPASGSLLGDEAQEYILVKLGAEAKHGIPLSSVSRMEEFKRSQFEVSGTQKVVRYRGGILKIISLNESFGYPLDENTKEIIQIIVVKFNDQLFGIEVNEIIDILSSKDNLDQSVTTHDAILGNLITKDEIVVVVDVERVVEMSTSKTTAAMRSNLTLASSRKILLVEDTASIRQVLEQELLSNGYDVVVAVDGVDGLKKVADNKAEFDVIISDIEMPKMNGIEFAKNVRTITKLKNVPLIAFTTKNKPEDLKVAKEAGFTSYLEKSKGKLLPLLISECLSQKRKSA